MTFYAIIKAIHVTCVVVSLAGFVLRGIWLMQESALLRHPFTKRLPHVVDTLLLLSAIILIYLSAQYPFEQNWLTAKLVALIVYILLGMVALRWGKSRRVRIAAWFVAVMVFVYIVWVALTRNPVPFIH